MTTALFSLTLFASAFLLFCIEPLVAKMLLPMAGGATAVWSTCLVFFQGTLLAGYLFTHLASRRLTTRKHVLLYAILFPVALLTMPISLHGAVGEHPSLRVLVLLTQAVGVPFFVLSTLAPAAQRWFAETRELHAKDPYFLYAASNGGSLVALAAYPFVIERTLDLTTQARLLRIVFALLGLLVLGCAFTFGDAKVAAVSAPAPLARGRRARWVLLAAVPSAQLVAVTTYLTTEIAPAPLLWAIPLAAYLSSFVLVFARKPLLTHERVGRRVPVAAVAGMLLVLAAANQPAALVFTIHVALLFVVALYCHGAIAADRPEVARLPEYYAWMSLGGVVGGAAIALGAPLVFTRPIEYPLCFLLVLACLPHTKPRRWAMGVAVGAIALAIFAQWLGATGRVQLDVAKLVGMPLLVAFAVDRFPRLLMWTLAAILVVAITAENVRGHVVHRERSFYGAFSVTREADGVSLMHGNTVHGFQLAGAPRTPTLYYTENGPIGDVMLRMPRPDRARRVGLIGLGTGTLATYAHVGEHWRFFELDPAVVRIARDPHYFTFLSDAFTDPPSDVVVGDARIELAKADGDYDLLVVDAFTSDSIPTHLLTREAFAAYRAKLADGAVIAWHISNRHLDLSPALAALADDAGWAALERNDDAARPGDAHTHRSVSDWVAMAEHPSVLDPLRAHDWTALARRPGFRCWTDERASIITVWK